MIEMTPELKKQLLELGRDVFDNTDVNVILNKLYSNSIKVLNIISGQREQEECGPNYKNESSPELISWGIALICIRYNLYLLKRKAIEGHCYNKSHSVPCFFIRDNDILM